MSGLILEVFADADYESKTIDNKVCVRWSGYVCGGLCMLIFYDSEMRYAIHHRGRVCGNGGGNRRVAISEACFVIYISWYGHALCCGVRG